MRLRIPHPIITWECIQCGGRIRWRDLLRKSPKNCKGERYGEWCQR